MDFQKAYDDCRKMQHVLLDLLIKKGLDGCVSQEDLKIVSQQEEIIRNTEQEMKTKLIKCSVIQVILDAATEMIKEIREKD